MKLKRLATCRHRGTESRLQGYRAFGAEASAVNIGNLSAHMTGPLYPTQLVQNAASIYTIYIEGALPQFDRGQCYLGIFPRSKTTATR